MSQYYKIFTQPAIAKLNLVITQLVKANLLPDCLQTETHEITKHQLGQTLTVICSNVLSFSVITTFAQVEV